MSRFKVTLTKNAQGEGKRVLVRGLTGYAVRVYAPPDIVEMLIERITIDGYVVGPTWDSNDWGGEEARIPLTDIAEIRVL